MRRNKDSSPEPANVISDEEDEELDEEFEVNEVEDATQSMPTAPPPSDPVPVKTTQAKPAPMVAAK